MAPAQSPPSLPPPPPGGAGILRPTPNQQLAQDPLEEAGEEGEDNASDAGGGAAYAPTVAYDVQHPEDLTAEEAQLEEEGHQLWLHGTWDDAAPSQGDHVPLLPISSGDGHDPDEDSSAVHVTQGKGKSVLNPERSSSSSSKPQLGKQKVW